MVNHISRQCTTLQYFANFSIFKWKSNLFIMEETIHEQQTEICDIRYCTDALLKALTTYNRHSATEMCKNYTDGNITSFVH